MRKIPFFSFLGRCLLSPSPSPSPLSSSWLYKFVTNLFPLLTNDKFFSSELLSFPINNNKRRKLLEILDEKTFLNAYCANDNHHSPNIIEWQWNDGWMIHRLPRCCWWCKIMEQYIIAVSRFHFITFWMTLTFTP